MAKKKATIQDIARAAGTSVSTVSRVLTGNAPVSDAKRAAVERAIAQLGYRPSLIARGLKMSKTFTIGVVINDITNPFYSMVVKGAESEAKACGYSLILCVSNENPETELHQLQMLHDKQVDGIIFGPTGHNTEFIRSLAARIPMIQVDRYLPDLQSDAVVVDNEGGAYQAVKLLTQRGHRRIGLVGWQIGITSEDQRIAGYCRALEDAGIPCDPHLMSTSPAFAPETMPAMVETLLARRPRPTAIFTINNQFGIVAMQAIRQAGLNIPDDVALVVFDDLAVFALTSPAISAVAQPAYEVGQRTVQLLLSRLKDDGEAPPQLIVLPTELIVRESA
ncbi:MAG: LacI family DNA-binding transcriptional regulator [Chloroflexota bacterium]|nr:LacI family DNA-binding transcriptional regulator [Chloroflexota bacterium]